MNNLSKTILLIIFILVVAFAGFYLIGKYILPDIFGETNLQKQVTNVPVGNGLVGKQAPAFNLSDINGNRATLAEYFGIPVVLVFWATWNKESADELSVIDQYYAKNKEQAGLVKVVSINSQEDPSIVSSYIKRGGYSTKVLLDEFGDTSTNYKISSLPTAYFISREGIVLEIMTGIFGASELVEKVDNILSQKGIQ